MSKKLKLQGFNNLTKTLGINLYDIYYVEERCKEAYTNYVNENYSANRLTDILRTVTSRIEANVLNIAKQDYEPQGASVNLLISEGDSSDLSVDESCNGGILLPYPQYLLGHLDKSHITVHTYPDNQPHGHICSVRTDIEVSTCGEISAINALNYLIGIFRSNVISIDYRVRGFTRDMHGGKCYLDHRINSIQDFVSESNGRQYQMYDNNLARENIFYTKMILNKLDVERSLFHTPREIWGEEKERRVLECIRKEMKDIIMVK